jgi:hypothetical protein
MVEALRYQEVFAVTISLFSYVRKYILRDIILSFFFLLSNLLKFIHNVVYYSFNVAFFNSNKNINKKLYKYNLLKSQMMDHFTFFTIQ